VNRSVRLHPYHPLRSGTDLVLCQGTRQIRVLSLPRNCRRKILLCRWEDSFGDCGLGVWPPPATALRTRRVRPSPN
jgi:hypothetical protein